MKTRIKCSPLLLAFCLIAASLMCGSPAARADNDDFNPNYDFTPSTVGSKGGDINLLLIVENTGPTDITWVGVGIDTQTSYSERWVGHPAIRPGTTRRLSFTVPFMPGDLDETRRMQVTMNNDGDAVSDGSKTFRFIIRSKSLFTVTASIASSSGSHLRAGDTVTVTMRFKNNIKANATNVVTDGYLKKEGFILNNPPEINEGLVLSGETKTFAFSYDLRDYDVGRIAVHYKMHARMLGRDYDLSNVVLYFDVDEALTFPVHTLDPGASSEPEPPEVKFTAVLSADPTEIDAGDTVDFRVRIHNTGDDNIGGFEITNMGGATEANAEGVHAGDDRSITISREISESCDVRFVVIGRTGDLSVSKQTNSVHITVGESPETASPSVRGGETASPNVSAEQSASATVSAEAPAESEIAAETAQPASSEPGTPDILYVLIIIFALIIIAGAVVIAVMAARRKKQ